MIRPHRNLFSRTPAGLFFVFVLLSLSGCDYLKFVGQKRTLKNEFHNHPKMDLLRKLNFKKVALLHDQSLYGKSLAESVTHQLHAWMISVVYSWSLTPGQSDATELLKKIQAAPDMIFFAGYYPEAAELLRAKRQLQWKVPLMGGNGVNHPQLAALAGNALLAFTQSATQIKTTETKAVADYLHRRYFNKSGLAGEIFFNAWGDVVNDLYAVYFVDANGRFILKKQILHGDFI
ncbi:MAG: ABC transporter substrate-binding protein [Smithella sp.]|nr:ABC transporter substrate-binding protein [Smithella sp.]